MDLDSLREQIEAKYQRELRAIETLSAYLNPAKKRKERLKALSLWPMTPEDAIRKALRAPPLRDHTV